MNWIFRCCLVLVACVFISSYNFLDSFSISQILYSFSLPNPFYVWQKKKIGLVFVCFSTLCISVKNSPHHHHTNSQIKTKTNSIIHLHHHHSPTSITTTKSKPIKRMEKKERDQNGHSHTHHHFPHSVHPSPQPNP